jgi:hypothetical protein
MFKILVQYIPGLDQIWVEKLNENDDIYLYEIEQDAIDKANELKSIDDSGRDYKVVEA